MLFFGALTLSFLEMGIVMDEGPEDPGETLSFVCFFLFVLYYFLVLYLKIHRLSITLRKEKRNIRHGKVQLPSCICALIVDKKNL